MDCLFIEGKNEEWELYLCPIFDRTDGACKCSLPFSLSLARFLSVLLLRQVALIVVRGLAEI